jgi:hypothetical protein
VVVFLPGGSDRFDFGERERGVIAWGVAASPGQGSRVHIRYVTWQKTDFVQTMRFELIVQLSLSKSHCLAVYDSLAGIDRFVGDLFTVQG